MKGEANSAATANAFTARQIAARLGRTPKAVRDQLSGSPITRHEKVAHAAELVPSWSVAAFPRQLREELAARSRGYRTIEEFLSDTRTQWQPGVPLKECIEADVDHAVRLQKALLPFLLDERPDLTAAEFEEAGAQTHATAFGLPRPISSRHWRRLHRMVLDRLSGRDDFHRLEIFLPPRQTARVQPGAVVTDAIDECFDLLAAVRGCANPLEPNKLEWELIRRRACEQFDALRLSCTQKAAKRRLGKTLAALPPFFGMTHHAIRLRLTGWLAKWQAHDGGPKAVIDGRENNTGNHDNYEIPESDEKLFLGIGVFKYRGAWPDAWRELWHGAKFTPATMKHFGKSTRARKSDVPKAFMRFARGKGEILRRWSLGKLGYNSMRALIAGSDSPYPPMLIISADDFTPDCRYGIEVSPGKDRMVRGQILLFIDEGTMRIIGYVIKPAANYNALMILGEMTRIFRDIGVPMGVHYERGIWEKADLVKGRSKGQPSMSQTEREGRFERLGVSFLHSVSSQGKSRMERTIEAMQALLRSDPGWCGRDEKTTCPQETKERYDLVNSGKVRARKAGFNDYDSFDKSFGELCARYNATRQEGKILKQLSPDDAFEQFFDPEYLPTKFTPELEHLLTEHVEEVKVTINGIRLPYGKGVYYKCPELGRYVGDVVKVSLNVLAWTESGLPEKVIVCDQRDDHHFAAYRETAVHPAMWLLDPDSGDLRKAKSENAELEAPLKALLNELRAKFRVLPPLKALPTRRTVGDAKANEKGDALSKNHASQTSLDRKRDKANRLAGVLGNMSSDEVQRHSERGRKRTDALARSEEYEKEAQKHADAWQEVDRQARLAALEAFERDNAALFE